MTGGSDAWHINGDGGLEMAGEVREIRVEMSYDDEPVHEGHVIHLERDGDLFTALGLLCAVGRWLTVRSLNWYASPLLNWSPQEHTLPQTRLMINNWGDSLFLTDHIQHRLSLTLQRVQQVVPALSRWRRAPPAPKPGRGP